MIDQWQNLWGTYDLNKLDDIFLQSEQLTYFSSEKEGLIKGYKALIPHHKGFGFVPGGKQPKKSLWLKSIESEILGKSAMVTAIWYFGNKTEPEDSTQHGPVTFVLSKNEQGNLKIHHAHFANY